MLEANLLPVIPGARMTVIEDTGHLLPLEAPGPVAYCKLFGAGQWDALGGILAEDASVISGAARSRAGRTSSGISRAR